MWELCLDIVHAHEKAVVNQPTLRRKPHKRNLIQSAKEASLLRPGHPYESSLVRLNKKAVPRKGPCPATRRGPWPTCPLLIQQEVAASADQQIISVMCHRELREMTKGESASSYKLPSF